MAGLTISAGLRKLEFIPVQQDGEDGTHAQVEFARITPLPDGEYVHVPLGSREGKLRTLSGVPRLIAEKSAGNPEYLYRVSGRITEESLLNRNR